MKKVKPSAIFFAGLFLCAASAEAYTLDGLPGTLYAPSAQPLGHLGLVISAGAFGHEDDGAIRDGLFLLNGNDASIDSNVIQDFQSATLRLNAAMGIGKHFDLGLSLPYHGDFVSDTRAKELSATGLGDVQIAAKGSATLAGNHIFDAALLATVNIPSKSGKGVLPKEFGYVPDDSNAAVPRFFSSFAPGGSVRALLTVDLSKIEETPPPFRASVGAGLSYLGAKGAGSNFLLGGGFEYLALPNLEFFINGQTETRTSKLSGFGDIGKQYSFLGVGFSAIGDDGIFFGVNVVKSLSSLPFENYSVPVADGIYHYAAHAQPNWAVAANLGWAIALVAEDQDHDGIPDKEDQCPTQPEDKDGFQDADGCPDYDNDGDGIPDAQDKCPNQAEDKDGFQDADGCPELDNDGDGIPDAQDKCPNDAEDKDGFQDADGCPDIDNDNDGIPDAKDKCPNEAEDKDGFEDADGCPDPDNDKDGICDPWVAEKGLSNKYANVCKGNDKCPNEPETVNGFEDADGCPDMSSAVTAAPLENRLVLKVHFLGNTAQLLPESYPALDTLAERIRATAGVMIEIRGYWDNASSELEGMRASEARANAVRKYLVSKGVESNQILARGMGAREPIANNRTAAGRQQNRRVEMHRMN